MPLLPFRVCWVLLCVLRVMKVVLGNSGIMINDKIVNVIIMFLEGWLLCFIFLSQDCGV